MAEHGMFKAIDLAPRLAEHGVRLSDSQCGDGSPAAPND
jgi:hypothetical protein